ncbi:hypothetical protein N7463_008976 [Penicillium fimorum]|uniref:Uncharacterized protein n=1 Tax=Penicillium fimorum TaxID=1882269 RepID=A0A9X0C4A1_9EURO|nr:hypothetical protein N7463_008976 [Penicillium fimorum]
MTTAAYEFTGNVYHPHPGGAMIGEITAELTHTDIALTKLGDGVDSVNELVGNKLTRESPLRLKNFLRIAEAGRHDLVYFDSPFSGLVEGQLMSKNTTRIPSDDLYGSKPSRSIWGKTQLMS